MSLPVVVVTSRRPPSVTWACPTCNDRRPFDCSERFRANTSGKLVDIWSIYRCRRCDATKNVSVVERTPVRRVPRDLLEAAQRNDGAVARRCARDVALLRRNGMSVAEGDDWQIDAPAPSGPVRLELPEPLLVRLDAVLAAVFGIPRRAIGDTVMVDAPTRIDALRLWSSCLAIPAAPRPRRPGATPAAGDRERPRSPTSG